MAYISVCLLVRDLVNWPRFIRIECVQFDVLLKSIACSESSFGAYSEIIQIRVWLESVLFIIHLLCLFVLQVVRT